MYCQRCGAQVDDQAAFCDKCGTALQNTLPVANAVTARPPEANVVAPTYPTAVQYAGFWRRLAAALIDGVLLVITFFVVSFVMGVVYYSLYSP